MYYRYLSRFCYSKSFCSSSLAFWSVELSLSYALSFISLSLSDSFYANSSTVIYVFLTIILKLPVSILCLLALEAYLLLKGLLMSLSNLSISVFGNRVDLYYSTTSSLISDMSKPCSRFVKQLFSMPTSFQ